MPGVQPPRSRTLLQSLLVRLYTKGIRLVVEEVQVEGNVDFGDPSWTVVDMPVPKRVKGSSATLSPEEQDLIDEHCAQLKTMLRMDREYAKELIRDVRGQLIRAYPIGRGCDISMAEKMLDDAMELLSEPKPSTMHTMWFLLDGALEGGMEECEQYRSRPLLIDSNAREGALER